MQPMPTVYVGNSNGVLYALDGLGVTRPRATSAADTNANTYNNSVTGNPGIDDTTDTTADRSGGSPRPAPARPPADKRGQHPVRARRPRVRPSYGSDADCLCRHQQPSGGSSNRRLYAIDAVTGPTGNGGIGSATPGAAQLQHQPQGRTGPSRTPMARHTYKPARQHHRVARRLHQHRRRHDPHLLRRRHRPGDRGRGHRDAGRFPPSDDTGRVWGVNTDGTFGFAYPGATSAAPGRRPEQGQARRHEPGHRRLPARHPGHRLRDVPGVHLLPQRRRHADAPTRITDSQGATTFSGAATRSIPMLYVGTVSATAPPTCFAVLR